MESGDKNSSHTVLNGCQSTTKPIQGQRTLRAGSNTKREGWGGGEFVPSGRYSDNTGPYPQILKCFSSLKAEHIFFSLALSD